MTPSVMQLRDAAVTARYRRTGIDDEFPRLLVRMAYTFVGARRPLPGLVRWSASGGRPPLVEDVGPSEGSQRDEGGHHVGGGAVEAATAAAFTASARALNLAP